MRDRGGKVERVRFTPVSPDRLVTDLADWVERLPQRRPRVVVDGFDETGSTWLADAVGEVLGFRGRPVVRVSTRWWWRAASLRLEYGHEDLDMLLSGWLDTAALRREVLDPLTDGGTGVYLDRLRDPATDRSIRKDRHRVLDRTVLIVDSPFAVAWGVQGDGLVHLQVAASTVARKLPDDRRWWVEAYRRYLDEDRPVESADVVVAFDHPSSPAVAWSTPG